MLNIHFAPLQGYTESVYRKLHAEIFSGIDFYYTPFLRLEKNALRRRDALDLGTPGDCRESFCLVPQIIAANAEEFNRLVDFVCSKGFKRIDLNLGCPFPMQTKASRGAALLQKPEIIQEIMNEVARRSDVEFSVKMRVGMESSEEGLALLPILNEAKLSHVTMHPRLGIQQYKGLVDMDAFERFYAGCSQKLVYNGDIKTVEQIQELEAKFPKLCGVMIGRGLLANPCLAAEYKNGKAVSDDERLSLVLKMHSALLEKAKTTLQGDCQVLTHVRSFWEYQEEYLPKKIFKRIMKSGNLKNYEEAVDSLKH